MVNSTLQNVHNTSRNKPLHDIAEKLVRSQNHQCTRPRSSHSKCAGSANSPSLRWRKNIHSTLVDRNCQVEQGEIQRQGENTTYPVFTIDRDQASERTLVPTNVSSFLFIKEPSRKNLETQLLVHVDTGDPEASTHSRIKINIHELLSIHTKTGSRKDRTSNRLHQRRCSMLAKPRFSLSSYLGLSLNDLPCRFIPSAHQSRRLRVSDAPPKSPNPHKGRQRTREFHHSSRAATVEQLSRWRTSLNRCLKTLFVNEKNCVWSVSVRTRINLLPESRVAFTAEEQMNSTFSM